MPQTKKIPILLWGQNRQLVGQRVINQEAERFCRKLHLKPGQRRYKKR